MILERSLTCPYIWHAYLCRMRGLLSYFIYDITNKIYFLQNIQTIVINHWNLPYASIDLDTLEALQADQNNEWSWWRRTIWSSRGWFSFLEIIMIWISNPDWLAWLQQRISWFMNAQWSERMCEHKWICVAIMSVFIVWRNVKPIMSMEKLLLLLP